MKRTATQQYQGLIFDIGDVVYDASPWRKWLLRELRSLHVGINFEQLVARWEALLADVYVGNAKYWDRFDSLLRSVGITGSEANELTQKAKSFGKQVQIGRRAFPGVVETLGELTRHGIRVGALSDTESSEDKVRKNLSGLGVNDFFGAVVTSLDCGKCKPDPEAYQIACRSLNVPAGECAFVGHDMDELAGASAAGLTSIAFNYHPDASADVFIDRFAQLLEIVLGVEPETAPADLSLDSTGELP